LPAVIAAKNFMIPSEEAKDTGGILGEVPENCICRWLAPEGAALNRKTADGNRSLQQEMAANFRGQEVESVPAPGARITKCTLRGWPKGGEGHRHQTRRRRHERTLYARDAFQIVRAKTNTDTDADADVAYVL